MNLIVNSITMVDLTNKEAKRIIFSPGKNLLTSNGNHFGKSVIMKSLYYTLGAEVYFPNPIKRLNLLTYLDFSLNNINYRVSRLKNAFTLYSNDLFVGRYLSVGEFEEKLSEIFDLEINLVGKDVNGTITKCPPAFYYLPYYIDQENGWATNSFSFDMDENVIEDIANIVLREAGKENPALTVLKQQLSETETIIGNLLKAIEQGIITPTTKQRMIELEQTKNGLELKIIKEEMKRPTITKEGLMFWLRRFQKMEVVKKEHKQRLINSFVNSVYLYDDKIVISFNYKEECKTVTLKEVNGSSIECFGAPVESLDTQFA